MYTCTYKPANEHKQTYVLYVFTCTQDIRDSICREAVYLCIYIYIYIYTDNRIMILFAVVLSTSSCKSQISLEFFLDFSCKPEAAFKTSNPHNERDANEVPGKCELAGSGKV